MTPRTLISIGVVLMLLVVGSLLYQRTQWHGVDPAVRDSLTVLRASKRSDSVAHATQLVAADSLLRAVAVRVDTVRLTEQHARISEAHATAHAQQAAGSTTAQDSAKYYRLAYLDERARGDSLIAALQGEQQATQAALAAASRFQLADSLSSARLRRVEALNVSLATELQRASSGCHLLPFVPCPTRVQSAAVAAVLTYVAVRRVSGLPVLPAR